MIAGRLHETGMPNRFRDLANQQRYRIERNAVYPHPNTRFRGGVDVPLI